MATPALHPEARQAILDLILVRHVHTGLCPDEIGPDLRDPLCPACQRLVRLGVGDWDPHTLVPDEDHTAEEVRVLERLRAEAKG